MGKEGDKPFVLGISDRLVAFGDIAYEGPERKVYFPTPTIAIMAAGDTCYNEEIYLAVSSDIEQAKSTDPHHEWSVSEVMTLWEQKYSELNTQHAVKKYLAPLGYDRDTFAEKQSVMLESAVRDLHRQMQNYTMADVEVIVAGVDNTGAHIYEATNYTARLDTHLMDPVGFSAIGSGSSHAKWSLTHAKYDRNSSLNEAIVQVVAAKKRSEYDPNVGSHTDIFLIGPGKSDCYLFSPEAVGSYEAIYKKLRESAE